MSDIDKLDQDCDTLMGRLADFNVSPAEAQELAHKFLEMTYRINRRLREVKNDIIPLELSKTISYSKAFDGIDGKANVSKAKALASADKEYLLNSAKLSRKENEKDYWSKTFDIFMAAHVFYKLLTRE